VLRPAAFIFDLDGTLADTLADLARAMNAALETFALPGYPSDAYRTMVGEGMRALAARAAPALATDPRELDRLVTAWRAIYADHLLDATRPYPGVDAMLDQLATRGAGLAVLSNKPDAETRRIVDGLFAGRFQEVSGHREGTPRKPDPTSALAIAARLGLAPASIAFVGDTSIDIATARAAGMLAIGVGWGFRPDELVEAGAALVIEEPAELLELEVT
jgi:phosphoglycolate phosphatase